MRTLKILIIQNGRATTSIIKLIVNRIKPSIKSTKLDLCLEKSYMAPFNQFADDQLIDYVTQFNGVIILGGSVSLIDIETHPHLKTVIKLLKICIDLNKYVMGICLGCQLIGMALGCKIYRLDHPKVGYNYRTIMTVLGEKDPIFKDVKTFDNLLSFHTDAIKINNDAELDILGISSECLPYIIKYRHGPIYGVQFHPEISLPILEEYLELKCGIFFERERKEMIFYEASCCQEIFNIEGIEILKKWFMLIK